MCVLCCVPFCFTKCCQTEDVCEIIQDVDEIARLYRLEEIQMKEKELKAAFKKIDDEVYEDLEKDFFGIPYSPSSDVLCLPLPKAAERQNISVPSSIPAPAPTLASQDASSDSVEINDTLFSTMFSYSYSTRDSDEEAPSISQNTGKETNSESTPIQNQGLRSQPESPSKISTFSGEITPPITAATTIDNSTVLANSTTAPDVPQFIIDVPVPYGMFVVSSSLLHS